MQVVWVGIRIFGTFITGLGIFVALYLIIREFVIKK